MTEDLSVFFADFAHQAFWGATPAKVLLNAPTQDVLGGKAQSNEYVITLPLAVWSGITRGDSVTVDGLSYIVRESPDHITDGVLMRVKLSRV